MISTILLKRYAGIGKAKIFVSSGLIIAKCNAGFCCWYVEILFAIKE